MPEIVWIYASKPEHIAERVLPAVAQIQFNTCSGPGHHERVSGRLLTFISYRAAPHARNEHLVGVRLGGENPESLQLQVVAAMEEEYANRTGGSALHIWHPTYTLAETPLDNPQNQGEG